MKGAKGGLGPEGTPVSTQTLVFTLSHSTYSHSFTLILTHSFTLSLTLSLVHILLK